MAEESPPLKRRALDTEHLLRKRYPLDDAYAKWSYVRPMACAGLNSSAWNTITFVRGGKEGWVPNRTDRMFVDTGAVHDNGKPVSVCSQYLQWYFRGGQVDPELVVDMWQRGKDLFFFVRDRSKALDLLGSDLWKHSALMAGPSAASWQGVGRGFRDIAVGNAGRIACDKVSLNITPLIKSFGEERHEAERRVSAFLQKCPHVGSLRMDFFGDLTLNSVLWDILNTPVLKELLSRTDRLYFPQYINSWQEPEEFDGTLDFLMELFPELHVFFERGITFRRAYNFESKRRIHSNDKTDPQSEEERVEKWPTI